MFNVNIECFYFLKDQLYAITKLFVSVWFADKRGSRGLKMGLHQILFRDRKLVLGLKV